MTVEHHGGGTVVTQIAIIETSVKGKSAPIPTPIQRMLSGWLEQVRLRVRDRGNGRVRAGGLVAKFRFAGVSKIGPQRNNDTILISSDRLWRKAVVCVMGVYGTTAPEYTCVSLRERTSAHFVRLRTPDLGLTFVLD